MRKIKDVLRLKLDAQLSHERIAAALNLSKGVVAKYVGLAAAAKLDWRTISGLDETALQRRLLNPAERPRPSNFANPDYGRIHQELRRKRMTLMLLWEEHVAQHTPESTHSKARASSSAVRMLLTQAVGVSFSGHGPAQSNKSAPDVPGGPPTISRGPGAFSSRSMEARPLSPLRRYCTSIQHANAMFGFALLRQPT